MINVSLQDNSVDNNLHEHKCFLITLIISLPPLFIFGFGDIIDGRYLEAFLTIAQGFVFATLYVFGVMRQKVVFIKSGLLLFSIFLLYLT